jgi:hypothetical protein
VDSLYLVRNGVPFDIAVSLSEDERLAWIIAMARLDGMEFDWSTRGWVET